MDGGAVALAYFAAADTFEEGQAMSPATIGAEKGTRIVELDRRDFEPDYVHGSEPGVVRLRLTERGRTKVRGARLEAGEGDCDVMCEVRFCSGLFFNPIFEWKK